MAWTIDVAMVDGKYGVGYQIRCIKCGVSSAVYQVRCIKQGVSSKVYQVYQVRRIKALYISSVGPTTHCIRLLNWARLQPAGRMRDRWMVSNRPPGLTKYLQF